MQWLCHKKALFCSSLLSIYSPFIFSEHTQKAPQSALPMEQFYSIIQMYEHSCSQNFIGQKEHYSIK